jgi:NADH:ubiquinone oxidoreductase subunit H
MISYSVAMSLAIISILLIVGSIEYLTILQSQFNTPLFFALLPIAIILIISCVAELGRPPLDLIEAESEIVSGAHTEYSGIMFAFFFLAEYSMMIFMGVFLAILLFGFLSPLPFLFFLFWIRASLPRVRVDQVLSMGWSHFLPFLTGYVIFLPCFLLSLDLLG